MAGDGGKEFSTSKYWDERYGRDDDDAKQYEWLRRFDSLQPFLSKHLPSPESNPSILHLGNGNSVGRHLIIFSSRTFSLTFRIGQTLPADMHAHMGHANQTAIDFSDIVTRNMQSSFPDSGVRWETMDIRSLAFADESFSACLDKATLDAMLYGSLWDPEPEVRANIEACVLPTLALFFTTHRSVDTSTA